MLPWFFTIIFTIMEMGNLAFHMIVINHAAYETARYGGMVVTPPRGGEPSINRQELETFLQGIVKTAKVVEAVAVPTVRDRQAGITNNDLELIISYDVPLIFPISNIILSKPPGSGKRNVKVMIRMPIERPLER